MRDMRLLVRFVDGSQKRYDVAPLLGVWAAFDSLKTIPELFAQVQVDKGGYGISWNDELDLSCDELWHNGEPVTETDLADEERAIIARKR